MNRFCIFVASVVLACPLASFAQTGVSTARPVASVPAEARQFDFLVGRWAIEARPKVSSLVAMIHGAPRLTGSWQASRSPDGMGVDDEMRIVDGSGNPLSLTRTHRGWVAADKRWKISGTDVLRKHSSESTAQWIGGEMNVSGHSADPDGTPQLTRTRYFQITPNSFRMQQDASSDNGRTWDEATIVIDAHRVAAPVSL